MRIHLGHHFYGAGNLGDDFMLAGFLVAMRSLAPDAIFTACVPFPLEPLRNRFPEVGWNHYTAQDREMCIRDCDVWLGLGGSPFQSAQSRWFIDHLIEEAEQCRRHRRPMFYLGVGLQSEAELANDEVEKLCAQAAAIWTRDAESANRVATFPSIPRVNAAADTAHIFFREVHLPSAQSGRITVVPNFDYGIWPGIAAFLEASDSLAVSERIWLAQESRELPGAERALHAALPRESKGKWRLVIPNDPSQTMPGGGTPRTRSLIDLLQLWPSAEWLVTSRYHAALAGAWSGSKIVVVVTNEKLRAGALELRTQIIAPDANRKSVLLSLENAAPSPLPVGQAERAFAACAEFVNAIT